MVFLPSFDVTLSLRGTSTVLITVPACFHTSTNLSGARISTWSCFSGSTLSGSTSRGGPGTCASALMRAMCVHTAVMRRKEIVTIRRSIIGIMLISESVFLRPPPPPPPSTPPMACSRRSGRDGREVDLLAVRDDEIEHLDARLVDVVLERLRLAVEDGVADEAGDRDDETE